MIMKSEQDKLRVLLTQAIPLMCKNILHFKCEFSVEALIGITLDKDHTLLVNINETVRASQDTETTVSTTDAPSADQPVCPIQSEPRSNNKSHRSGRKRKNTPIKSRPVNAESEECMYSSTEPEIFSCDLSESSEEETSKKCKLSDVMSASPDITVKEEAIDEYVSDIYKVDGEIDVNLYDDDCEAVMCEEESQKLEQMFSRERSPCKDGTWAVNHVGFVGKNEGSSSEATCSTLTANTQSSVEVKDDDTSNSPYPVVMPGLHYSMTRLGNVPRLSCHTCGKSYGETRNMVDHIYATHLGILRHHCKDCGKTFGWRSDVVKHRRKGRCPYIENTNSACNTTV